MIDERLRSLMLALHDEDHALSRAAAQRVLHAIDAVDQMRHPTGEFVGKTPIVLYFGSPAEADEFVQIVRAAMVNPVEVSL